VLDFADAGRSAYAGGMPARVICALPVSNKVQKERSNSWIPIFNNDKTMEETWSRFHDAFVSHPCYKQHGTGSIVRFGSLLGGSYDGPDFLRELGLDEGMYKVRFYCQAFRCDVMLLLCDVVESDRAFLGDGGKSLECTDASSCVTGYIDTSRRWSQL
jgi:hypothetical protein